MNIQKYVKKLYFISLSILAFSVVFAHSSYAEPPDQLDTQETYVRGNVLQVLHESIQTISAAQTDTEILKVMIVEGKEKGKVVTIGYTADFTYGTGQRITKGTDVIVDSKPDQTGKMTYSIYEVYRMNNLWWLVAVFVALIMIVTGRKGLGALAGLAISIVTISLYIIPHLIQGENPLYVCVIGACVILFFSTYIAHGISLKTTVAVLATALSLFLTVFIAIASVQFLHILGIGNQDLYDLQLGTANKINPQGLLLGSIIIGTLGALNDITTTQSITIFTLAKENPKQRVSHLFLKSMAIGREHITSLINTLVLAYVGSSLGIFIFVSLNPVHLPLWLILNDETTMEEIVRTIVGSSALILAVPITTILASYISLHWKTFISLCKDIILN